MSATDWLARPVVPMAWCWRVERRDGAVLGLTTHDADIMVGGLLHRSAPGIRPSAIKQVRGISGDSMDIDGALTADAITPADLAAGRWDGARLTLLVVDWQAADARQIVIATGALGEVRSDGLSFTAEMRSADTRLEAPVVPETSAECRAELGDRACRVAMAARTYRARAIAIDGRDITLDRAWSNGVLAFGRLRWITGPAKGLYATIEAHEAARIALVSVPEMPVTPGTMVELTEGCDKRASTCSGRFANIMNFRGEPHLPGIDLLTRFAGG